MRRAVLNLAIVVVVAWAASANGQETAKRRFEITPYGGVVWSRGYDVLLGGGKGNLSTEESPVWGVSVGYAFKDSLTQIEVLYNRQDTQVTFEFAGEKTDIADVSIEYLHAGGQLGVERGNVLWYTSFSLGMTRFGPKDGSTEDEWRFSIMFGLGAKHYFNDRLGLRVQARAPYMFVEDSANVICGDSGCLKSTGGRGIWQFDLSLGLIVRL